jgi:hypothetical protein
VNQPRCAPVAADAYAWRIVVVEVGDVGQPRFCNTRQSRGLLANAFGVSDQRLQHYCDEGETSGDGDSPGRRMR